MVHDTRRPRVVHCRIELITDAQGAGSIAIADLGLVTRKRAGRILCQVHLACRRHWMSQLLQHTGVDSRRSATLSRRGVWRQRAAPTRARCAQEVSCVVRAGPTRAAQPQATKVGRYRTLGLGARAWQQGGLQRIAFARPGTGDGLHDARKGGNRTAKIGVAGSARHGRFGTRTFLPWIGVQEKWSRTRRG